MDKKRKFKDGDRVQMAPAEYGYKGVATGTVRGTARGESTVHVQLDGRKRPSNWPVTAWELIPEEDNSGAIAPSQFASGGLTFQQSGHPTIDVGNYDELHALLSGDNRFEYLGGGMWGLTDWPEEYKAPYRVQDTPEAKWWRPTEREQIPWCASCGFWPCGPWATARGIGRWRCPMCAVTFLGSHAKTEQKYALKRKEVQELFRQGLSLRQVCVKTGVAKDTAAKYRREIETILCACGQDIKHQGWCRVRFARSPKRQAVLAKLHGEE